MTEVTLQHFTDSTEVRKGTIETNESRRLRKLVDTVTGVHPPRVRQSRHNAPSPLPSPFPFCPSPF